MAKANALCLVCGEPLVYWEEAREVTCDICGTSEFAHSVCEAGHYVCDACHRAEGVDFIMELCARSKSADPIEIMAQAMGGKSIYPNGPEHHTLVGAALVTACSNAGGCGAGGASIDKQAALAELKKRSLQVPGGTCGYWGTCGAAVSAGQAFSILAGATPLTQEPWAQCQRLTSLVLGRLADLGGPRCCKRSAFTAAIVAVPYINDALGSSMRLPTQVTCMFFGRNAECRKQECPYFPNANEDVKTANQPNAR